MKRPVYIWMDF